ncbi:MAG: hypothetical protein ACYC4B_12640 [Pirellulaceae bacterium]
MKLATRRRICQALFVALCLVPTLSVVAVAVVRETPAYHGAQIALWQARLSDHLGLEVQVGDVTIESGARSLVRDIELRDPESHEWLARIRSAEMIKTKRGWAVRLSQPQVSAPYITRLASLLHEHVLLRADGQDAPVQLAATSVELSSPDHCETVLDLRSAVQATREGSELLVEFRSTTMPADQRVRLRIVRNRQLEPAATGWELHTSPAGLPCSAVAAWFPAVAALGEDALFQGSLWCEQNRAGWEAELNGVFRDIDLEQLVTRQFPHKLSGMAMLSLSRCRVHRGRVSEITGRLESAGGVVSQSLLDAAAHCWGLQQPPRPGGTPLVSYEQLVLDFSLSGHGLILGTAPAALLTDRQGTLLSLHDSLPRSPLTLVQLLVPQSELQVPATRETAALFGALPLPELSSPPAATARGGYSPLRLQLR